MQYLACYNEKPVFETHLADNFVKRLRGLLVYEKLEDTEALLITKCNKVHTFNMKFDIDVIFLSKEGEVLHIQRKMRKNRVSPYIKDASCVLETAAGAAESRNIKIGGKIDFKEQ